MKIWETLDKPSVAAFVGAFSAFILVMATDWIRRRSRKRQLRFMVDANRDLARRKIETVKNCLDIHGQGAMTDAPIMPFTVQPIEKLQHDIVDLLDSNQYQAISGLLYWMRAIDELLDECRSTAVKVRDMSEQQAEKTSLMALWNRLEVRYQDALRNLDLFVQLSGYYVDGKSHLMLEHRKPMGVVRSKQKSPETDTDVQPPE